MKKLLKWLLIKIPVAFLLLSLALVLLFRFLPVWITPYMVIDAVEHRSDPDYKLRHHWVRMEKVSPQECVHFLHEYGRTEGLGGLVDLPDRAPLG